MAAMRPQRCNTRLSIERPFGAGFVNYYVLASGLCKGRFPAHSRRSPRQRTKPGLKPAVKVGRADKLSFRHTSTNGCLVATDEFVRNE